MRMHMHLRGITGTHMHVEVRGWGAIDTSTAHQVKYSSYISFPRDQHLRSTVSDIIFWIFLDTSLD
jgi:hypothetical protein